MRYTTLLLAIFAAVGISSAQPASADIIPGAAAYFTEIDGVPSGPDNGGFQSTPQADGGSVNSGTLDESASASATAQPLVSASAASTGCTPNGCGGGTLGATAKVDYFLVVSGPGGEFVPLDVAISGGGSVSGDYATGYVSVQVNGFDVYTSLSNGGNGEANPATCSSQGCINTTIHLNALPNVSYEVQMEASAGAYDDVNDSSSIWADPYIYIDPAFTDASLFSVEVSPDVGNSPASVPEPTAVALFVIGLVGLGAVRITSKQRLRGLAVVGSALILGFLASPPKAAAGTVSVIEDVSGTPGDRTLDFSILNNLTAGFDAYFLGFPTLTTASDVLTGSPSGWAPVSGGVVLPKRVSYET